jgi:glycosyltransferase involved in cell wall biosynthesis
MRVLHISHRFWPAVGGAETYLDEFSRCLAAQGHQVTVATTDALDFELLYTPGRRRIAEREAERDGVRVVRFPVRHLPGSPLAYAGWRRMLWALSAVGPIPVQAPLSLARYAPWVPDLERWLRSTDEPFDLVAGMNICFESLSTAGLRFARRRGVPFVMHPLTHLGAGDRPGADKVGRSYTMRHQVALVRASDAVVAQTPTERAFYVDRGVSQERVHVVGPGVDPAEVLGGDGRRFRERHGIRSPLVVSLSAMARDKGTVQVVEAVRHLWRAGRQVELALAGAVLTPFRQYLDHLPARDRERIRVLGSIDEREKRDLLAACDMLAMPSRTDSFGIVYLEAWLYRKPVIGARAWGIDDVIEEGRDGLLVPFGDAPALAEAVAYLLDHPAVRSEMGARGERKVYQSHQWGIKHAAVRDLYGRLVDAGAHGQRSDMERAQ